MTRLKTTKLYSGSQHFKYLVNIDSFQAMMDGPHIGRGAQSELLKIIDYNKIRDWAWDTWGPSCDLKDYDRIAELKGWSSLPMPWIAIDASIDVIEDCGLNTHWCFSNERLVDIDNRPLDGRGRSRGIYLAGDEELAWLELRWK